MPRTSSSAKKHGQPQTARAAAFLELFDRPGWDVAKERPCLVCRQVFQSAWSGERICRHCKRRASWRDPQPGVRGNQRLQQRRHVAGGQD